MRDRWRCRCGSASSRRNRASGRRRICIRIVPKPWLFNRRCGEATYTWRRRLNCRRPVASGRNWSSQKLLGSFWALRRLHELSRALVTRLSWRQFSVAVVRFFNCWFGLDGSLDFRELEVWSRRKLFLRCMLCLCCQEILRAFVGFIICMVSLTWYIYSHRKKNKEIRFS